MKYIVKLNKYFKKIDKIVKSKYFVYFLLAIILVGSFAVRLWKIDNPVADWHSWRQADTASVSKVFLQDGIDLLHPKYHDISKIQTGYFNPEGYRYVEFPIFNFVHVVLYKSIPGVGFDVWGRLVSVLSAVFTTYFLFGIGRKLFGYYVGLSTAFFYAFLPFNIYFTRVILPDPMSVMFGVGAVYFFAEFADRKRTVMLLISSMLLSLGMLVKPHAIFFGIPIAYLALTRFSLNELIKNKWVFISLDIILIPFLLWRIFMYSEGLLRGIAHWKWAFNGNGIRFRPSFWRWIFGERVGKLILGGWGLLPFGVGVITGRKLNILHAFLAGAFLYVSIFASANVMHDYYQVFIVPAIALGLGVGVHFVWTHKSFHPVVAKLALLFAVGLMFAFSFYDVRDNYRINDTGIIVAGKAADELLPKDAIVIAPYNGDTAFLYQTGRQGFPAVTGDVQDMIDMGAQYYISVNLGDKDTVEYRNRFTEVVATDRYVIIDLTRKKDEV